MNFPVFTVFSVKTQKDEICLFAERQNIGTHVAVRISAPRFFDLFQGRRGFINGDVRQKAVFPQKYIFKGTDIIRQPQKRIYQDRLMSHGTESFADSGAGTERYCSLCADSSG